MHLVDARQARDGLVVPDFCLLAETAQLAFSEKGYRKMAEMLKTYRHALADEEVLGVFKARAPAFANFNLACTFSLQIGSTYTSCCVNVV